MENDQFEGQIVVASRIVDLLSSGLYKSPAACLKELINNSYDADAKRVDIFVKPDADRIIIEDDGTGMSRADFEKNFKKISESHKREDGEITKLGRPKIGKIGIGFIAANEICDAMEIVSTKAGSKELLEVNINFEVMRQDPNVRRKNDTEFAKADYVGHVSETDKDSHFTKIFLKNVRGEAKSILSGVGTSSFASGNKSLYGLNPESIYKELTNPHLKSWSEFDPYSKNRLEVSLNIPVQYYEQWIPSKLKKQVFGFEENARKLDFSVYFDGSQLRKPIIYKLHGKRAIISLFDFNGAHVSAKGYFYAQHSRINPQELQGLLIRIRNAALGNFDPNFLSYSPTLGPLFQSWISGEIMADDRLEDAMNIDRQTLREAHPAYAELQKAIHSHLDKFINRVKKEIYIVGSKERKSVQAEKVKDKIFGIAKDQLSRLDTETASQMRKVWGIAVDNPANQKKLLQKYTVDELYEIVIGVASEILKPAELKEFIKKLTERLYQ